MICVGVSYVACAYELYTLHKQYVVVYGHIMTHVETLEGWGDIKLQVRSASGVIKTNTKVNTKCSLRILHLAHALICGRNSLTNSCS